MSLPATAFRAGMPPTALSCRRRSSFWRGGTCAGAAIPDRPISRATCAGTLLLGCGLALMLHDAMVVGVFILFFCLWWAVSACEARRETVTMAAVPAPRQADVRACRSGRVLAMA